MTQFGEQMQLTIKANMPDSVIKLHDQATKCLSDEDYHAALMLCINETEHLKESLGDDFDKYVIPIHHTVNAIFNFVVGEYKKTTEILNEVLLCQEKAFGKKHPILGAVLNNIAVVHRKEENYVEVEKLARRALYIYDQSTCHEHLGLVEKLNELALYFDKGEKYQEAERCYNRALRICEANLSPDDPLVATASNELAMCYLKRGKFKDAEVVFKRVLSRAYDKEFGDDTADASSWLQMLGLTIQYPNKHAINIWQTAEERERDKGKLHEKIFPFWYKPANFATPTFNVALNSLEVLYERQGKHEAAKTLRDFANQPPEMPETAIEINVQNLDGLSTTPATVTDNQTSRDNLMQPSSAEENESSCATVSQTRIMMVPPSAPPISALDEEGEFSYRTTSQIRSPSPLSEKVDSSINLCSLSASLLAPIPKSPSTTTRSDEQENALENVEKKIIAELQAEIAEKARRLAEAERALETHGAFCCICLDEVANRMWSGCNHLAACSECAETLLRTEENRSDDGVACPKCRTHGRPLPAFI